MASTDGKTTLVDKLTAIANAIRGKTDKTNSLTIDQMVNEINTHWHNYVKEVVYEGSFDNVGSLIGTNEAPSST